MSDHDFEKKVQQKMDELRLRPSDAVWAEVERNLRREKRRRRIVLWLPLMGILLTAGGYFIFKSPGNPGQESLAKTAPAKKTGASKISVTPSTSPATEPGTAPATAASSSPKSATGTKPSSPELSSIKNTDNPTSQNSTPSGNKIDNKSENKTVYITGKKKEKAVIPQRNIATYNNRSNKTPKQKPSAGNKEEAQPEKIDEVTIYKEEVKEKEEAPKIAVDSSAIVNKTNNVDSTAKSIKKADSTSKKATPPPAIVKTPVKKKKAPISKWQYGVTASAGVANISEGNLFDVLKAVRVEDLSNAQPIYNGIPPVPSPEASPIDPGGAFAVGGFVQRNLSNRFSLSAGLRYSYFSVNTRVGRRVDSALAVNYSAFNVQMADRYYRGSDIMMQDYVNRYHFIELPVTASYRIVKNKNFPLMLDAGLAISQLVNTTALHFDGISGVYYENDDFFNKTQVSLNGSLNLGLLQNSRHPLWIGPNLRFFTSGLIKREVTASAGEQHIWSFGINAKMLLKK